MRNNMLLRMVLVMAKLLLVSSAVMSAFLNEWDAATGCLVFAILLKLEELGNK